MKINLQNLQKERSPSMGLYGYSRYVTVCSSEGVVPVSQEDFEKTERLARIALTEYIKKFPDATLPFVAVKINENHHHIAQLHGDMVRLGVINNEQYEYLNIGGTENNEYQDQSIYED